MVTAPIVEVEVTAKMRVIAYNEAESIASRWTPAYMTARQGLIDDIADSLINARRLERDAFAEREAAVRKNEREACYRTIANVVCNSRMHDIDDGGCDCLARAEAAIRARSNP